MARRTHTWDALVTELERDEVAWTAKDGEVSRVRFAAPRTGQDVLHLEAIREAVEGAGDGVRAHTATRLATGVAGPRIIGLRAHDGITDERDPLALPNGVRGAHRLPSFP